MSKIVDLFGVDVEANPHAEWSRLVDSQMCPFVDKVCFKVRKSEPDVSIGTCTIRHGRSDTPIMICPQRLLERNQIFSDCLHLLKGHSPGNAFHVVPEIRIPGGAVDYFLVSASDGRVEDFVGIELQTIDTTGTVWPERQRLIGSLGIACDIPPRKSYGMNWKMTAKTILVQLHHKARTFESLNRHLVLVVQDVLMTYMQREFEFGHLSKSRTSDPMQFHPYRLDKTAAGHRLVLSERYSTDAKGVADCLGIQAETDVELRQITTLLEQKISHKTLFSPLQSNTPPATN